MKENASSRASAIRWPGGLSATAPAGSRGEAEIACDRHRAAAVDMRLDDIGDRIEARVERLRLARLDEAEVPLRQSYGFAARQRADDRNAERLDRVDHEAAMPLAADTVDDHAGDLEAPVVSRAALDDRGGRLGLARDVDDEEDRHAERGRDVRRRAAAPARRGHAVEQPHRGFAERQARPAEARPAKAARRSGAIAQESRLTPSAPDAAAWKAGSI